MPAGSAEQPRKSDRQDRKALLHLVRGRAAAPSATKVATMLLLADAIGRSGHAIADVLAILRRSKPIIVVRGEAIGFEASFVDLLKSGIILPGTSWLENGHELRAGRQMRVSDSSRRTVVHFPGRDNDDDTSRVLGRSVGLAVQSDFPILVMADEGAFNPEALIDAADLILTCAPVSADLIAETIRVVLKSDVSDFTEKRGKMAARPGDDGVDGPAGDGCCAVLAASGRFSAHSPASKPEPEAEADCGGDDDGDDGGRDLQKRLDGCEVLALADLALSIRPGRSPERCIDVMRLLIERRRAENGNPAQNSGAARASSASSRWSSDTSTSRRGKVSSGSTVIEPEPICDGKHQSTAASPAKMPVRVEALSGYGDARDWALGLKADLELWNVGSLPWSDMSTRLPLAGPPGTGKTAFARALGNTLQLPVYATSVGIWLEPSYLGDVLARMAAAFAEAQANAPCILFIDEIDGIGRRSHDGRGKRDDYWNSVANRALELMDGALETEGVILIGATNHAAAIDPALLRSGRLETRIDIPMPDVDALVGILRHHLGDDAQAVLASQETPPVDGRNVMDNQLHETSHPTAHSVLGDVGHEHAATMQAPQLPDGSANMCRTWPRSHSFRGILARLHSALKRRLAGEHGMVGENTNSSDLKSRVHSMRLPHSGPDPRDRS